MAKLPILQVVKLDVSQRRRKIVSISRVISADAGHLARYDEGSRQEVQVVNYLSQFPISLSLYHLFLINQLKPVPRGIFGFAVTGISSSSSKFANRSSAKTTNV